MRLPAFLKQDGDKLIFKGPGELVYYIPEQYFSNTKTSVGTVVGSYISTIGIFDWALVDTSGKVGKANPFKFPTILLCKPSSTEKVKNLSLNGQEERDYRVLHFKEGDEAISDINIPKIIDNVEAIFKAMIYVSNKMPPTIPYDKIHEYLPENMSLNAGGYGLNMQLFGILFSELCRDPNDITQPFRRSEKIKHSMFGYKSISIKEKPKFDSPYVALGSENWDEALLAAIDLSNNDDNAVSPLERIVTG